MLLLHEGFNFWLNLSIYAVLSRIGYWHDLRLFFLRMSDIHQCWQVAKRYADLSSIKLSYVGGFLYFVCIQPASSYGLTVANIWFNPSEVTLESSADWWLNLAKSLQGGRKVTQQNLIWISNNHITAYLEHLVILDYTFWYWFWIFRGRVFEGDKTLSSLKLIL